MFSCSNLLGFMRHMYENIKEKGGLKRLNCFRGSIVVISQNCAKVAKDVIKMDPCNSYRDKAYLYLIVTYAS